MRKVFAALAGLLMVAVMMQFVLAGVGAFSTEPNDESFGPHRALGYAILLYAVLLTLLAALLRMPGKVIGLTALVAGLVLLQGVIRAVAAALGDTGDSSSAGELVFGLHAINGLIIFGVTEAIIQRAKRAPAGDTAENAVPAR